MVVFVYSQVVVSPQVAVTERATWAAMAEVAAAEAVVAEDTKKVSSQPQETHETDLWRRLGWISGDLLYYSEEVI